MEAETCTFVDKPWYAYTIGIALIFGVLISYIPQHVAIIRSKTSQGISWITIFLANVATCCNVVNAILEQWDNIACCGELGVLKCNATLLSVYQIGTGWINSSILFILVLAFFPKDPPGEMANKKNKIRGVIGWFVYIILFVLIVPSAGGTLLALIGPDSKELHSYAFSLGIIATVSNVIQYTPQIIKTLLEKDIGSLSILMLLLQAPGSFLVVVFQGIMYKESVSTWLPFFITGVQQVILLIICIVFEVRKRKRLAKERIDSETVPLIVN